MPKPFHLGWFLQGSSVQAWGEPWTGSIGRDWRVPDLFVEMTRALERACFDYVLIEDSSYVGESFGAPDAPVGELTTNGHQQSLAEFLKKAAGRTLRQTMGDYESTVGSIELAGTPDGVAAQMGEVMAAVGGDGYLFSLPNVSRRVVAEVADGLVPALQRRGLVRRGYEFTKFRDNLLAY